jgi:hypothetical protein
MKFSSILTARSSASALILAGAVLLGVHGIANAQSGSSGNAPENPADYSDKKDPIKGHTGEGYGGTSSDTGQSGSAKRGKQGQAGYNKENPADYTDKKDPIKGHTGEGYSGGSSDKNNAGSNQRNKNKNDVYGIPKEKEHMDQGYVDQQKRVERNQDPRSPSPDPHVPDFPTDKQGRPLKDLSKEQGGPIGPN